MNFNANSGAVGDVIACDVFSMWVSGLMEVVGFVQAHKAIIIPQKLQKINPKCFSKLRMLLILEWVGVVEVKFFQEISWGLRIFENVQVQMRVQIQLVQSVLQNVIGRSIVL